MSTNDLAREADRIRARLNDLTNALNKRHDDIVAKARQDLLDIDNAEDAATKKLSVTAMYEVHWKYQAQRDAINAKMTKDLAEINPSAQSGASTR